MDEQNKIKKALEDLANQMNNTVEELTDLIAGRVLKSESVEKRLTAEGSLQSTRDVLLLNISQFITTFAAHHGQFEVADHFRQLEDQLVDQLDRVHKLEKMMGNKENNG